jgi:predicted SAM-dependent methyltransferase
MKLNLGCGPHILAGWTNLDLEQRPGVTLCNLANGLPSMIEENSVGFIFTEHFIEHIPLSAIQQLLRDCHRVLRPGGTIRISTPSLNYLVELYKQGKVDSWAPTWHPATPCQMMNEGMREWGHMFLLDGDELKLQLRMAGFEKITWCQHRKSTIPELANLEVRPYVGDLIMEATK